MGIQTVCVHQTLTAFKVFAWQTQAVAVHVLADSGS